jgi:hypothetical protein
LTHTAGINWSNTAVRAVLEQPCLTGGRTGTVRPKHLPAGRTGLSNQFLGPVAKDQPEKSVRPVGSCFDRTVPVLPPVEHGCSSTAWTAVFDRLMPAVKLSSPRHVFHILFRLTIFSTRSSVLKFLSLLASTNWLWSTVYVSLLLWQSQPDKSNIKRDIITTVLRPTYMTKDAQKNQFTYFYPMSLAKSWHHKNK